MSDVSEKDVATALLGSWPGQVASWGPEGIAAYCNELRARGVTPERALFAIRACPADQKFPPSAPELAGLARDSERGSTPTFEEMLKLVYAKGGILRARPSQTVFATPADQARAVNAARIERAKSVHPLVGSFAVRYGLENLFHLPLNDPEWGGVRRRELEQAWEHHVEAQRGRELAEIAAGVSSGRGELSRFDPLAALNGRMPVAPTAEIEAGR